MHILIITPYYSPDIGPSAPLFTLLSESLVKRGHDVSVIAAVPHYPSGKVTQSFRGKWITHSIENGVVVTRVPVPSVDRTNFKLRILQFINFQFWSTWASLFRKYDVLIVTNPAIETWLPSIWHSVIRRKPMVYSVFDVYPDVGIKLGIFKANWMIKIVTWLEQSCLKPASIVQIISENFISSLKTLGVPDSKLALIPIWVDTELIQPLPHDNCFSKDYGLNGKFVVLYAGNIGISQGLENVLIAAEQLSKFNNLYFVFVGDGAGRENLQMLAEQQKLTNVKFIPFQSRERLPEVLACANISLIILRRGIGIDSLPSKTFSAMASGRPILASVDRESELQKLISRSEAGICVLPENPDAISKAIVELMQDHDLRTRLGTNGRQHVEQNNSVTAAATQFEKLFDNLGISD